MAAPTGASLKECLTAALGGDGPDTARWASAWRMRCRLQPAGGPGTKVMPPTYLDDRRPDDRRPIYIEEERRIGTSEHRCVLLDSVASQANRLEEALANSISAGDLRLPVIQVDQRDFGTFSGLQFSHRCFDAWIEDARLDGRRFGESELFKQLATSTRHRVTVLMETFPAGIVLGCWASRSKDPQGAARLPRILASEIIAVDAVKGARPASRIDRHPVSAGVTLWESEDRGERWTLQESRAVKLKDKPKPFGKERGQPAGAGYGNQPPGLAKHGGITMDHALQIATVSLPGLRECRFPIDGGERGLARDVAGRLMLAALALRMLAMQVERGYDLRSGCLLVPEHEPTIELVGRLGQTVASWPLIEASTDELLEETISTGADQGLHWDKTELRLSASDEQLELLRQSLAQAEA